MQLYSLLLVKLFEGHFGPLNPLKIVVDTKQILEE